MAAPTKGTKSLRDNIRDALQEGQKLREKPDRDGDDDKIIQEAKERFKRASDWESTARQRHVADVRFAEGDSDNKWQWDQRLYADRELQRKPALTINKTRQHNLQIVNDARQNKAQIRVRPVGGGATFEAAQVFEGIVRHIEYISNAVHAYDTATWHQVTGGVGYWRVLTDYVSDDSFEQEIYIRRVKDPLSIYLDPDIDQYDGSDARWGFVFRDVPKDEFFTEHPDLKDEIGTSTGLEPDEWMTEDHIRVAEYFRKSLKPDTLYHLVDGTTVLQSDLPEELRQVPKELIRKQRKTTRPEIEWYKIAGNRVIEERIWPGIYIPIVRVIGEETVVDGQYDRKGHTRGLKDPQRMYNYWSSAAVEYGALQTKTPWVGPLKSFEGLQDYWKNANTENRSFLPYNHVDDDGRPLPAPVREQPPTAMPAAIEGMKVSQMELMMASGQYQSQFGENENAKSGVAINARQRQGDNATYHYIDHQGQAIGFTGRILIDLIPKIYDTPRLIKIMAEDGSQTEVNVDPNAQQPHQRLVNGQPANDEMVKTAENDPDMRDKIETIFNPTVGRYDVEADVGPAFATRRQETFNALSQLMSQNQQLTQIAGDLLFRAADFPMADEIAERIKRTLPPQVLGEGPPPQVAQMQQEFEQRSQALGKIIQELTKQNADKQLTLDKGDKERPLKEFEAETRRLAVLASADPEALKPYARAILSEALGQPIVPLMGLHKHAEALHGLAEDPEATAMSAEGGEPGGGEGSSVANPAPGFPPGLSVRNNDAALEMLAQGMQQLAQAMGAPRELIYGPDGRPAGSRIIARPNGGMMQ